MVARHSGLRVRARTDQGALSRRGAYASRKREWSIVAAERPHTKRANVAPHEYVDAAGAGLQRGVSWQAAQPNRRGWHRVSGSQSQFLANAARTGRQASRLIVLQFHSQYLRFEISDLRS